MEIRKIAQIDGAEKEGGGVDLPSNFPAGPGILTYLAISPDQPPPVRGVAAHFSATLYTHI